jgi:K+-sensing histidine kinase KdpD
MNKFPDMLINPAAQWRFTHPAVFARYTGSVRSVSLCVLMLIGWLDYITGYELGFFIFYFVPVAISAWYSGRRDGISVAIASAVCWYLSDLYTFHPYSNAFFIYWEVFMRLISFLTTAVTLSKIRSLVLNEERMIAELLEARSRLAHCAGEGELKRGEQSPPDGNS